jgi:hypothetical protein
MKIKNFISYIRNLFKNQTPDPTVVSPEKYEKYSEEIILEIVYLDGSPHGRLMYTRSCTINAESEKDYTDTRVKKLKEFSDIVTAIHKNLDDKSSEYISVDDSLLIKKSEFQNAKIITAKKTSSLVKK